jgi:hypothetical protein
MKNKQTNNPGGNWVLGLLIIIIILITLFIFTPKFQTEIDKFINLDLKIQNPAGIYQSSNQVELTKWNDDAYQTLQLDFTDIEPKNPITKVKLDFKDTENNNVYSYSSEIPGFLFKLNLPAPRTYLLYIYINNNIQPTFLTYLQTNDFLFNFTDVNGNIIGTETTDNILILSIQNPDKGITSGIDKTTRTTNLGTLWMQPYNMVNVPINIPQLQLYKNLLKSIVITDPVKKAAQDAKIAGLDNFVFKEIRGKINIIGLPANMGGASQNYSTTGTNISIENMTRFERKFPNPAKLITPSVESCIQADKDKCALQIRNLVNDTTYRLELSAVYQQLGSIEPNIRYTKPQYIEFKVSNSKNLSADLNETIKINDIGQKYISNRAQRDFIRRDQTRQDVNMTQIEDDMKKMSDQIYRVL